MRKIKALILAAGKGRRLGNNRPKPLTMLLGKPLIEYVLEALKSHGVTDVTVVYSDERVKNRLKDWDIKLVYNDDVERGGGYSLLKGAEAAGGEPFILLMGDHIFDPAIISRLIARAPSKTTLCIDRAFDGKDTDEATKVLIDGERILDVGKLLKDYTALDTGIFYCSPEVLESARRFNGCFSVSDIMRSLAQKGRLCAMDVTGHFWRDIDTKEDLKKAEESIIRNLSKPSDGFVSKHINRRISLSISRILAKTSITPNQISLLSFFLGIASGVLFAFGQTIFGGGLAQLSSIIDGCDGEVARMTGQESKFGAYFDSVLDRYADVAIILGMTALAPSTLWLPGALALLGSYSISYSSSKAVYYTGEGFVGGVENMMTRDVRLFLVMLGGVFNQVFLTLWTLAILTNTVVTFRIYSFKTSQTRKGCAQQ